MLLAGASQQGLVRIDSDGAHVTKAVQADRSGQAARQLRDDAFRQRC